MPRKPLHLVALVLAVAIVSARADAQQQTPPPAPGKPASGQAAAPEAPKPPAELQKFTEWVGAWEAEQHMLASPMAPESREKGRTFFHWILNAFHLEGVHNFKFMGRPVQARSIWSYDAERKEYTCVWLDGMSPMVTVYSGNFTPDGKLVMKATYTMQGKPVNDVVTWSFPTPDSYSLRYETDMWGSMKPMVEETGRRMKPGGTPPEEKPASDKPAPKEPAAEKQPPKK